MNKIIYILIFSFISITAKAQNNYFPPLTGTVWETSTPQSLGWCTEKIDTLYKYLDKTNTKAFIVLKNGRIVLEKYFGTFTSDSTWYWASAGKTLTGFTVGIAQQEGLLKIQDTTSKYLGKGWSALTGAQEDKITIRNQLTMTTGLNDGVADTDCTLPSCLLYKADVSTRWAYHNAPYTLLDKVIESATGSTLNTYVQSKIRSKIGMTGLFVKVGYNNIHFSTARSMARFGLLLLNKGQWGTTTILSDTAYWRQMTNSSQNINPSYGYLTWLNGKSSLMVPSSQIVFPTSFSPNAPAEMFAALGKNGQIINIIPTQGLVVIRMGDNPDNSLVPFTYCNDIWKLLSPVICNSSTAVENALDTEGVTVYPNPSSDKIFIRFDRDLRDGKIVLINQLGQVLKKNNINGRSTELSISDLSNGVYWLHVRSENNDWVKKVVKN
jgi:CubicO group peptidase (beta-lactamase class C family)